MEWCLQLKVSVSYITSEMVETAQQQQGTNGDQDTWQMKSLSWKELQVAVILIWLGAVRPPHLWNAD